MGQKSSHNLRIEVGGKAVHNACFVDQISSSIHRSSQSFFTTYGIGYYNRESRTTYSEVRKHSATADEARAAIGSLKTPMFL